MEKDKIYQDCIKILEIERSKSIDLYKYKSIELWPWIRRCLLDAYLKKIRGEKIKQLNKNNLLNLKLLLTHSLIYIKSKKKFKNYLKNLSIEKTDVLIVDQENDYLDKINYLAYNRYSDPFYELLKSKKKVNKITTSNQRNSLNALYPSLLINCEELLLYYFSKHYLLSFIPKKSLQKVFEKLISELDLKIDLDFCVNNFVKILSFEKLFISVLSSSKPKIIFCKMFYSVENMGLNLAAKKLGIKVIDIQHGKNGKYNHMMSCWSRFPKNGYKLLPDFFWTWGDYFSTNINTHFPKNLSKHHTISGGNLWLSKCIHQNPFELTENESVFLEKIKSKNCILFALQPIDKENTIPEWVINAIIETPEYFWLIRRHPRQSTSDVNYKNTNELENVDTEFASTIPLSVLLNNCIYNITLWSSVCIDALEFNVKSAIIHQEGFKIYEKEIGDGVFDYCTNEHELKLVLKKTKKTHLNQKKMISDPEIIKNNLLKFVESFFTTT
ncbi:MAG: hypothetical protein CL853_04865 [Crocinitomicaceae bacterium]|nr:hypothetical protein [Crocinitomicaceae bacterium]|tara:strand:+ start:2532 stop:4025 length:1494 start_codon:yes stop_codon:yes gene_type:complete